MSAPESSAASPATLWPLITGYMPARVIHVAAELGIADLLATEAKTADALAQETDTAHVPLRRLLRALASIGLVEELESGRFALTAAGSELRSNVPGSMRNVALMFGGERAWRSWGELLHSVRTGESGTRRVYGVGTFEYLAANPEQAAIFNAAMAENTERITDLLVSTYDFSQFPDIVDIGGGDGTLMASILAANAGVRGTVFDLPSGVAQAPQKLIDAVLPRCEIIAGNFFHSVPEAADAYVLKYVIHDWDDEKSVTILRNCRKAMHEASKILLIERIMPERIEATPIHQRIAMGDMNMMAMPGGQERTEREYRDLFAAAGLLLERTIPLPGSEISVISAKRG
ncbi:methyltransferase [Bradyrhizobium sp. 190]|uniref:acetylserotonin O-methyltransferase n=1 Tax=Bradyrhizobium sp. 190 TaxID=2782658 RepID=UPI001FF9CA4E|nr:acetylserotonin O-methyltransferase [Bradyrhizobium sp. 190]MCK1516366.1 methyltransferase [Bradyrhizobium sp. 190]